MTVRVARIVEGGRTRTVPVVMLLTGFLLLYLMAFDQGQALGRVLGDTAFSRNYLHEFFHDGRHLFAFACH